jgi:hypothetical protein
MDKKRKGKAPLFAIKIQLKKQISFNAEVILLGKIIRLQLNL